MDKQSIAAADLWLQQFDRRDREDAERLLSAIRSVSADEFRKRMGKMLRARANQLSGPVGMYVESKRGHWKGRAHRLFSETGYRHRRAVGAGPPVIRPRRTIDQEVGSEGIIAQIVTEIRRQNRSKVSIHPGPDQIRNRKIRRFILVTDFIGTGERASRYLDAAWRVRSIRSWWSARRAKGMSFEVVAFAATDEGRRKVEAHPTKPTVFVLEGARTIKRAFDVPEERLRMEELCERYGSFNKGFNPLGYGGSGVLIAFAHGMPNNAPAIFHKRSSRKGKPWMPLYPNRVTTNQRAAEEKVSEQKETILLDLQKMFKQRVLSSPKLLTAPRIQREAVRVLLSLDRAPHDVAGISARSGLSTDDAAMGLARAQRYGWVDGECRITKRGRRELARLGAPVQKRVQFGEVDLYIPHSLRMPRNV